MIREEIQCIIDDSRDVSNFSEYSSLGGSFRHRKTRLVLMKVGVFGELGISKWGSVHDRIELSEEESTAIGAVIARLHDHYTTKRNAKTESFFKRLFAKRLASNHALIDEKAGEL